MFEFPVLFGDIGGTNARFAVQEKPGAEPVVLAHEKTAAYPDPSAAIRAALAASTVARPARRSWRWRPGSTGRRSTSPTPIG